MADILDFSELRRYGLLLTPRMLLQRRAPEIKFEAPCRLNDLPLQLQAKLKIGAYSYIRGG